MPLATSSSSPVPPPIAGFASVHARIEAQVRRTPDAVALVSGARRVTYAELWNRAGEVARWLRGHGVGPEVRVAVCMERTPELVAVLLGVLRSGGAYVPVDPAYPRARIDAILADTRPAVVLAGAELTARLPAGGARVVAVDDVADAPDDFAGEPPPADADNLSHVIHTSGSTGTPRGVMIRHGAVAALIDWARGALGIGEGTAVLASTSVCFDVHVAETWVPLALGARIVLVPNALHLASLPPEQAVEVASMVPSAAAELLRLGAFPPTLRSLNLGGEPVRPELARALYALPGTLRVLNLWGPTEDTTYSTCALLDDGPGPVAVGLPVTGTVVHVLDAQGRPAAEGEVFLTGAGLGRGYLGRPAATAERWLPDPFGGPGSRMYRVGDRGRWMDDGRLQCLGRVDHQVKVRGFRVELGEVEEALRAHPAVGDAVAAVREDAPGDRLLVAYAVPAEGRAPEPAELRAFLAARLPDHAVPGAIGVLDALPRLPNGKVDRGALPAPAPVAGGDAGYVAPRTPAEAAVCRIWEEVLGAGRVSVDADFFDLGGHSLRATQVVARLRETLGAELSPFALFELRTPADVARAAERAIAVDDGVPPLAPGERTEPVPLSFSQQAIWFFQALSPGMTSYNFQATIEIVGRLEVSALERALGEIVRRHEIFRTEFVQEDGVPRQRIRPPYAVRLPIDDLRGDPAALEARLAAEFARPFRLDRLPLVRWTLYRLADDRWTLAVVEHHFVHDGWSFGVFLAELAALYAAYLEGRPSPLAEPEVQFADYALWQRRWMAGAEARRQLEYWRGRLAPPVPVLALPTDRPRPATMSFRGASRRYRLSPELAAAAHAFSRRHGVTLFTTLMAAYHALLHRHTGQTDFAVGAGVANRNERAAEGIIGMIVNTVAIRAELAGDPAGAELLARVHRAVAEAYAHREVPFGEVVEAVQPGRTLSHLPVYQAAFSFHDAPYPALRLPGARMEVTEALANGSAKFDLQVVVIPRGSQGAGAGEEVAMVWEHATDLFDDATVERMEARWRALLAALLATPERRVSALPMIGADERGRLLAASTGPAAAYEGGPVHERVERRARGRPDALAVAGGGRRMTYGALDAAANRIANALAARGVRPGSIVGVCLERSPALVAALLGVLKAGAAYLPLDRDHPRARRDAVLADARAAALIVGEGDDATRADGERPVLPVAADGSIGEPAPEARMGVRVAPAMLACVVYTSGSTGAPKGVMIEHRGLANVAGWTRDLLRLEPDDRGMLAASVAFDALGWELWPFLAAGASVHVPPPELRADPDGLAAWIGAEGVTSAFLTTRMAEAALTAAWPAHLRLRALMTGGERMAERPGRALPFAVHNNYGPTEATILCTSGVVEPAGTGAPPLGSPVPNVAAYLLEGAMNPAPPGVAGELFVGGVQVARGYLGRPAATAAAFLPDPFGSEPGARLYRTGDRARLRGDGALEFLGRMDGQVKVRGFRVEPGEVEAALRAHPAVSDAVVALRAEGAAAPRLVAWAASADARPELGVELREWLAERLPAHMVPSAIGTLVALPLTPNGKADVAALPLPDAPERGGGDARTPAERALAALVAEVLGVDRVGVDDGFFALGGDSLLAIRLASRASAGGIRLTTRDVFAHQTVAAMAAHAPPAPGADELAALEGEALAALLRALDEVEGGGP